MTILMFKEYKAIRYFVKYSCNKLNFKKKIILQEGKSPAQRNFLSLVTFFLIFTAVKHREVPCEYLTAM